VGKIKIAIVDDQQLFRKAIAEIIAGIDEFKLILDVENGRLLLDELATLPELPDVVLVDLDMPVMNGVELNIALHIQYPSIKVIVLTVFNQERFITKMITDGANGYLAKNCDIEELILAINAVHKTGFYFNEDCIAALRKASLYGTRKLKNINNLRFDLTDREREILLLICKEYTNSEIAALLHISIRTAEGHRNNLLLKIGCKNTAGLVIFAIKNGLYEPWLS